MTRTPAVLLTDNLLPTPSPSILDQQKPAAKKPAAKKAAAKK